MQIDEPNATIVLDSRRAITSGENKGKYPVKLRVTFPVIKEGKTTWLQKYYATGFYLNESEYRNAISDNWYIHA